MSCSKIFSGNLPELTENIINFIKYLNLLKIVTSVENWFYTASGFNNLYYIKKLIISLLKIFVENEVNLHTLEIEINFCIRCFDGILELILQNPNFIRNIKNLKLFILRTNNDNNMLIINRVLQVINLHQNLKNILLSLHSNKEFLFYQSLLSSKDSNCSNTLNTITFYRVDFKGIINLDKTIEQLNVLESVHIIYCRFLNISFIQQILNLIKPFKLKSLFINATSEIDESLLLLLQKSGGYLKNFSVNRLGYFWSELKQQILESVIKYCKSIKFLDIDGIKNEIIYPVVLNLIENIKQNLNCLFISSERFKLNGLQNLGQILPSKLEYLDLTLCIEASDFEVFLKNSKGTFIKKLLIRDLNQKNNNDIILPYIKKYIMKEKRVRYLNFRNLYNELFDFSDEVKEFKLYNIKVQKYNDLHFDIYQFMQKLD
ncbi:uncharacterized protein OCT59_006383 [Rhizophagus irregularis]|uniref:F-box domain-containing protein n=1 Tax=Rhizophagus irregularis (strain DAOM 181602 / DAOM 197198 / MUCL 43194) TaxID=747089 RepID=A0A2H5RJR3_RHIID|nr:hypothetical protein GLOIN_2v1765495 [Rhizophagus irregularis DAOM 181602=DAOM 197198]POG79540.1 hypothetical protein GLOIN_2v1765495 [Rhizophagus irregularis DAOM 181602=DAOM 197198]UZO14942.1 hypothetical protein OCT59_006383 [Rhizophagus irregularis]GBC18328.1 hypothetical protein GLOIN_2v1765495 [Rhizophagus irregularis DAOM 181602=DAOM 197198]|eukprot:XP_025186406.1 hypothetical protein GLOIN_2v1765495 [Rhizophagus irregularis DAOM 181602=DAOM 197198]